MFVQTFYFVSYYFYWIEYDDYFFYFQETYNSRLRERYGNDPLTISEFDPDLWMEVRSAENLWAARSVSTVGSTQSKEFVALQQHTAQLIEKYDHLLVEHAQQKAEDA